MMMPKDTNPHGIIFGGVLLSYIDQAGAIKAREYGTSIAPGAKLVTVAMDAVQFHEPVFVGDIISLYAEVVKTGRSSIVIKVTVTADRFSDPTRTVRVTESTVTYVAVDEDRHPVPLFEQCDPHP